MKRSIKTLSAAGAASALTALVPMVAHAVDYDYNYSYGATDSAAAAGIGIVFLIIWGVVVLVAIVLFIFWIFMLVDALKRTNWKSESDKTLWMVILVVGLLVGLSGLAAIVYYFAVKRALDKGGKPAAPSTPAAPSAPAQK